MDCKVFFKEVFAVRGLDVENSRLYRQLYGGKLKSVLDKVKDNKLKYFLGIRDEYINVYYMGGSLLKISCNSRSFVFEFDDKYFKSSNKQMPNKLKPRFSISDKSAMENWLNALPELELCIEYFQNKTNPTHKEKSEKKAQQQILMNNNDYPESEYLITDMEYSTPGIGYGRFDFIAVKKEKDSNGKHRLALIELKYGESAFGTNVKRLNGLVDSYGSGIVGHAHNFYRFVFGDNYQKQKINDSGFGPLEYLRNETYRIIINYCNLGLIDDNTKKTFENIKVEDLNIDEDKIATLLLCVSCNNSKSTIDRIKKYLGAHDKKNASFTVKKDVNKSNKLNFRCYVTEEDGSMIKYLQEKKFVDLEKVQ